MCTSRINVLQEYIKKEGEKLKLKQEKMAAIPNGMITLNVGGTRYTTTTTTLRGGSDADVGAGKGGSGTFFDTLLSGRFQVARDADGAIFIDRDGRRFRHVLNFLRAGSLHVTEADPLEAKLVYEEILEEAQFFGLERLVAELECRIANIKRAVENAPDEHDVLLEKMALLLKEQRKTPMTSSAKRYRGRPSSIFRHENTPPRMAALAQETLHEFNLNVSF